MVLCKIILSQPLIALLSSFGVLFASENDSQKTQVPGFEEAGDVVVQTQNLYEEKNDPTPQAGSPLVRTQRIPPQTHSFYDWARELYNSRK